LLLLLFSCETAKLVRVSGIFVMLWLWGWWVGM
jgi:hypothetical protein